MRRRSNARSCRVAPATGCGDCVELVRLALGPVVAQADLVLPPIVESFSDCPGSYTPPPVIGLFNQMKQEYASARFMLYEGLQDTRLHFSDRGVQLFDTLDYPMHSLATERVRTAFRIAYSLLGSGAIDVSVTI